MKSIVLSALLVLLWGNADAADSKEAELKQSAIAELIALTAGSKMSDQLTDSYVTTLIGFEKRRNPDMPKEVEEALSVVFREVYAQNAPKLVSQMVPLYDKYYSYEEVKQLVAFYRTDVGRKYLAIAPKIFLEMVPVAQKWGESLTPVAAERAKAELKKFGMK